MSPFVALVTTIIVIIFYKILIRLHKFIKFCLVINKLPGPSTYPLPTTIFKIIKLKPEDRLEWFCQLFRKYDKGIMMVPVASNEALVYLCKPRHLEVIFPNRENIQKSFIYDNLDPWLGKALLTSTGQKWFHQRKMTTPAFHFGVVHLFIETMSEKAEILNEIIEERIKQNPDESIDIFKLALRCALDIICETAMGVNINAQRNYNTAYTIALQRAAEISLSRINYPWLQGDWIFYKTKLGKEFKSAIDTMTNFTMEVYKLKFFYYSYLKPGKRKKKAFLDLLLDMNENEKVPMSETELRERVDTLMFAGHDTTAAAINWAIFNLGNNLEIQKKVHEELDEVFGDSKEPATMKQIAELQYLDRVIKENLRLNPSVPGIGRRLTEDIELDGYLIPKGCNISMSIFNLHRDSEVWPDPLKFDPDRFLPEISRGRHPYAYVPFSAGPRNCIGQKFAIVEQKIVLTALLRKLRVKSEMTQEKMKLRSTFILRPHEGNPIYFTLR